jgi:hypothetical protein
MKFTPRGASFTLVPLVFFLRFFIRIALFCGAIMTRRGRRYSTIHGDVGQMGHFQTRDCSIWFIAYYKFGRCVVRPIALPRIYRVRSFSDMIATARPERGRQEPCFGEVKVFFIALAGIKAQLEEARRGYFWVDFHEENLSIGHKVLAINLDYHQTRSPTGSESRECANRAKLSSWVGSNDAYQISYQAPGGVGDCSYAFVANTAVIASLLAAGLIAPATSQMMGELLSKDPNDKDYFKTLEQAGLVGDSEAARRGFGS